VSGSSEVRMGWWWRPRSFIASEPLQHMVTGRGFEPSMLAMDLRSQGCKPVMTTGDT
jgi:hypothetical protein